jgi:hypothetical protein
LYKLIRFRCSGQSGRLLRLSLPALQRRVNRQAGLRMEAVFKVKANELDQSLFDSIKKLFKGKDIVIKVSADFDETAFLSFYPANEKHILENMTAEPAASFTAKDFQDYVNKPE